MNTTRKADRKKVISILNQRVLEYKFLGQTNTKPARVKIIDRWFEKSITISYDTTYNSASQVAIAYIMERGWTVCGKNTESNIIIMSDWDYDQQLK